MRNVLMLGLILLGSAAVVWWWQGLPGELQAPRERPPVPVSVVTAQEREFREEITALGTLRAWESVTITSSVSQIVTSIAFEDGQQVEKGQVLALLKQDAEQATLRELQASLQDAKREVRRLENLARQNQVAQTELDKARTQADVTRHQIEAERSRIADRTIVAPFSGVLGLRKVSEGALLTPGDELTTLDDISQMRLDFTVPATLLSFLSTGQLVEAGAPAFQQVFHGEISALDTRIDPVARSVRARATIENPRRLLRPGLLMEVLVRGPARQAVLLPEECLQSRATEHFVWVVADGMAQRTRVTIGARTPGWVEITDGLPEGARVVRDGLGRLSGERMPVNPVES